MTGRLNMLSRWNLRMLFRCRGLALKRVLPLPKPPQVEGLSFECSAASHTVHKKSLCISQDYVVSWSYQVLLCKLQKNVAWCMQQARYLRWKQAFHWLKSLWSDYPQNLSSVFNKGIALLQHWEPEFCWKAFSSLKNGSGSQRMILFSFLTGCPTPWNSFIYLNGQGCKLYFQTIKANSTHYNMLWKEDSFGQ